MKMVSINRVVRVSSIVIFVTCVFILLHDVPIWRENSWSSCPRTDSPTKVVSVIAGGRLGNMVWEYLSVWSIALRYGFYPLVPQEILSNLNKTFQDLSIPAIDDVAKKCNMQWLIQKVQNTTPSRPLKSTLDSILNNTSGNKVLLLRKYEVSRAELRSMLPQVRKELRFREQLERQAQDKLRNSRYRVLARLQVDGEDVSSLGPDYVGIHVRRTDYIQHLQVRKPGLIPAGPDYYFGAMQVMRALLKEMHRGRPVFVVASDDVAWCRQELEPLAPDLIVAGTGDVSSPSEDLALLAACNHTIFAYGTFGLTAATLAGGYTIMYTGKTKDGGMKILPPNHTLDY